MGNRANVVFTANGRISPAIYLHWNGGPESVYAFVAELDRRGCRADAEYEAARFVQVAGDFFDSGTYGAGTLSLGVVNGPKEITPEAIGKVPTDSSDNGFYVLDRTGGATQVRRFTDDDMQEMSPEEVAREYNTATTDPAYNTIRETLAELHPKVNKHG